MVGHDTINCVTTGIRSIWSPLPHLLLPQHTWHFIKPRTRKTNWLHSEQRLGPGRNAFTKAILYAKTFNKQPSSTVSWAHEPSLFPEQKPTPFYSDIPEARPSEQKATIRKRPRPLNKPREMSKFDILDVAQWNPDPMSMFRECTVEWGRLAQIAQFVALPSTEIPTILQTSKKSDVPSYFVDEASFSSHALIPEREERDPTIDNFYIREQYRFPSVTLLWLNISTVQGARVHIIPVKDWRWEEMCLEKTTIQLFLLSQLPW